MVDASLLLLPTPPPFLSKAFDMVDDPSTDAIVSWKPPSNSSFVVWDLDKFSLLLLPRYFKHSNFSSFVRQLNTYGFRKIDPDHWEFANDGFLSGQKHLLANILRKRSNGQSLKATPSMHEDNRDNKLSEGQNWQIGKSPMVSEIEQLKHDRNMMKVEMVQLRQQQVSTNEDLQSIGKRIQSAEHDQQQMMLCLKKVIESPFFLSQLMQHHERKKQFVVKRKTTRVSEKTERLEIASSNSNQQLRYEQIPVQNPTSKALSSPSGALQRNFSNGHTRSCLDHEMPLSKENPFELDATFQIIDDDCGFNLSILQEDNSLAVVCKDQSQLTSTNDALWEQFFNSSMDISPYLHTNGCCKGQPLDE